MVSGEPPQRKAVQDDQGGKLVKHKPVEKPD
jgi:hypothetical protein